MKIILSAALSVDGHIAGAGGKRLLLSHEQDLEEVYDMRDTCDAILVGAETIRRDNPSLSTKTEVRRKQRLSRGLKAEPVKATITRSGLLSPDAKFFTDGDGPKIVYCPKDAEKALKEKLGHVAEVIGLAGDSPKDADGRRRRRDPDPVSVGRIGGRIAPRPRPVIRR
jgi:5-amino-6-(5-phosphoribosylamino)uracil reductase